MSDKKIISFVDHVGRVVVGEYIKTEPDELHVREPAVVNVQVNQENGQISVQLLPFIFREFISPTSREEGVIWKFKNDNVVTSDNLVLDDAIKQQYDNIFNRPVASASNLNDMEKQQQKPESPEVVKLFDDED